eukprot:COSAG03_NODE_17889_length_366_cov_0.771536_1_plen_20_part_01
MARGDRASPKNLLDFDLRAS